MIFDSFEIINVEFCINAQSEANIIKASGADCTIVFLSEGSALISASGEESLLTGTLNIFIARGDIVITPAPDCTLFCAGISGIAAQKAASALHEPVVTSEMHCKGAKFALQNVVKAYSDYDKQTQSEKAFELLCRLANANENSLKPAMPALVSQAALHMQKYYSQLYGIEELSDNMGVSKNHLVREFSKFMGTSPGAYLTNIKLESSKQFLAQSDYSLETIASLCGFSCANYFCKVFKKSVGISPGQFRLKQKQANEPQNDDVLSMEQNLFV